MSSLHATAAHRRRTDRARRVESVAIYALLAVAFGLSVLGAVLVVPTPTPIARYLDAAAAHGVTAAPGYTADLVAAGYDICAELDHGTAPADVIAAGVRDGLAGGDLYPRQAVESLVAVAPVLCPAVA